MSRIFRLRYGWKKGGASSSEWVYRESFESMVEKLEDLLLHTSFFTFTTGRMNTFGSSLCGVSSRSRSSRTLLM